MVVCSARSARCFRRQLIASDLIGVCNANPARLQLGTIQAALNAHSKLLRVSEGIDGVKTPKRHLIMHQLGRLHDLGSPNYYSSWLDESLTTLLKL